MENLEQAKAKYVGKYYILHNDNEDGWVHIPTHHKLIYIGDLYQCHDKMLFGDEEIKNVIEISEGVGVQWKGGIGQCTCSLEWLSAVLIEERYLEEITKKEFMEIYDLVTKMYDNAQKYISKIR